MELISRQEAKAAKLKLYFTGKPCPYGHICARTVCGTACVECRKALIKRWRSTNHAKELEREWQERNRESVRTQERVRYAKNPEKQRNKARAYYARNAEAVRQKRRAYHYEVYKDPEVRDRAQKRTKEWSAANSERARVNAKNGKARRKNRNIKGKFTANDIAAILKMQKNKCAYCKQKLGDKYHIDHIMPVSRGGTNDPRNLQITCIGCNLSKGATDPVVFSQRLGMLL